MEINTDFEVTNVFTRNDTAFGAGKRRALNEGGTSSSKTVSILQLLICLAIYTKKPLLISVVSETLPHLKKGAIRDFFRILRESEKNNPRWNATDHVYTFGLGVIEFFSVDDPRKGKGPRRQILFINEGDTIPWETAEQLDIRTEIFTFVDWNPTHEFWAHEHWLTKDASGAWCGTEENAYIHSTYLDAIQVLPQSVVDNIESKENKDPNWWNVYGLGLIGKIVGLVYPFFTQINTMPDNPDIFYGLDFGFSLGNPCSLGVHCIEGDNLYSKELIYETGLTNATLAQRMEEVGVRKHYDEIFADSEDPKAIEELCLAGFNVKGVKKGPGSVEFGHQKVRQYNQYWTKDSVNSIKEQRYFMYIKDKNGKFTEKTTHAFSHAMDERRYAVVGRLDNPVAELPPEPEPDDDIEDNMDFAGLMNRRF